jgi:hypothetical protein
LVVLHRDINPGPGWGALARGDKVAASPPPQTPDTGAIKNKITRHGIS